MDGLGNGGDILLSAGSAVPGSDGEDGDIKFKARGSQIQLNEEGDTDLKGFMANSIVGAVNELNAAEESAPASPEIMWMSNERTVNIPFDSDTIKSVLTLAMVALASTGIVIAICMAVSA